MNKDWNVFVLDINMFVWMYVSLGCMDDALLYVGHGQNHLFESH